MLNLGLQSARLWTFGERKTERKNQLSPSCTCFCVTYLWVFEFGTFSDFEFIFRQGKLLKSNKTHISDVTTKWQFAVKNQNCGKKIYNDILDNWERFLDVVIAPNRLEQSDHETIRVLSILLKLREKAFYLALKLVNQ